MPRHLCHQAWKSVDRLDLHAGTEKKSPGEAPQPYCLRIYRAAPVYKKDFNRARRIKVLRHAKFHVNQWRIFLFCRGRNSRVLLEKCVVVPKAALYCRAPV